MRLIATSVVLALVGVLVLAAGFSGCEARLEVFGENLVRRIDRLLGEDEVRIKRIEQELGRLQQIREDQRVVKYTAQVRAESYERRALAAKDSEVRVSLQGLADQCRTAERRASSLLAATDAAVESAGKQLQAVKEKYRLLKEVRAQAEQAEYVSAAVDPQAVGQLQDSMTELFNSIEARLRAVSERADLAIARLPGIPGGGRYE